MFIYFIYVVLLCLIVFLSIKLANLVDLLDKKTKISGAFIGGVLLAAVTSLPELFTSISAVIIVKEPSLVIGNILGSDIFNLMILSLYTILFFKNFKTGRIEKWHFVSIIALFLMYSLTFYAVFVPSSKQVMLGSINLISIINLVVYIILIIKQPKETQQEEETDSDLSIKQIIILFAILSIILIGCSIAITHVTQIISNNISWLGETVAGAILLGVATSLPEIISTFHLFKLKNFDAGYGNMIGSCTFNFLVLSLADFISWSNWNGSIIIDRGIFIANSDSRKLVIFGLVSIISTILLIFPKLFSKFYENKKGSYIYALLFCIISFASYILVFII